MPFKSRNQERYLQINEPEIYRDWVEEYGHFSAESLCIVCNDKPVDKSHPNSMGVTCNTPKCVHYLHSAESLKPMLEREPQGYWPGECLKCGLEDKDMDNVFSWSGNCKSCGTSESYGRYNQFIKKDAESFGAESNEDITIRQQAIDTIEARVADYTTHEDVNPYSWGEERVNPNKYLYFKLRYAWEKHPEDREGIIQQYIRGIEDGRIDPSNPLPHGEPNQHLPSKWDAESFNADWSFIMENKKPYALESDEEPNLQYINNLTVWCKENPLYDMFQEEQLWVDEVDVWRNYYRISFVSNWPHPEITPKQAKDLKEYIEKYVMKNKSPHYELSISLPSGPLEEYLAESFAAQYIEMDCDPHHKWKLNDTPYIDYGDGSSGFIELSVRCQNCGEERFGSYSINENEPCALDLSKKGVKPRYYRWGAESFSVETGWTNCEKCGASTNHNMMLTREDYYVFACSKCNTPKQVAAGDEYLFDNSFAAQLDAESFSAEFAAEASYCSNFNDHQWIPFGSEEMSCDKCDAIATPETVKLASEDIFAELDGITRDEKGMRHSPHKKCPDCGAKPTSSWIDPGKCECGRVMNPSGYTNIRFSAELKRDSCCCGATKSKPCACMIQGVMECNATCPCSLEKSAESFSAEHFDAVSPLDGPCKHCGHDMFTESHKSWFCDRKSGGCGVVAHFVNPFGAESFNSYKVAADLSSYTKAELVSSIAGPQGTAAYQEVVYDPIAQSRMSAETATQRFKDYGNSLAGDSVCPACGSEDWDESFEDDEWRGYCGCGNDFSVDSAAANPLLTFYELEALKEQGTLTSDQKEYLEWTITSTLSDLDSSSHNKKYIQDELVAHGWTLNRWGNAEPPKESASTLVVNAESVSSFSPTRLMVLGASIGVALGLYKTRSD